MASPSQKGIKNTLLRDQLAGIKFSIMQKEAQKKVDETLNKNEREEALRQAEIHRRQQEIAQKIEDAVLGQDMDEEKIVISADEQVSSKKISVETSTEKKEVFRANPTSIRKREIPAGDKNKVFDKGIQMFDAAFENFLKERDGEPFSGTNLEKLFLGDNHYSDTDKHEMDKAFGFTTKVKTRIDALAAEEFKKSGGRKNFKTYLNREFRNWTEESFRTSGGKNIQFESLIHKLRDIHERIEEEEGQKILTPFMEKVIKHLQVSLAEYLNCPKVEIDFYNCLGTTMDKYYYADAILQLNIPNREPMIIFLDITKNSKKISDRKSYENTVIVGLDQPNKDFKKDQESFLISVFNWNFHSDIKEYPSVKAKVEKLAANISEQIIDQLRESKELGKDKIKPLYTEAAA